MVAFFISEMSEDVLLMLFYLILSICLVYPPEEFISAGFTLEGLFSRYLGSEDEKFVNYHIKRSILTLLVYSFLPLGYILMLLLTGYVQEINSLFISGTLFWKVFFTSSFALPLLALYQIKKWTDNDFKNHPIAVNLDKFRNNNDWKNVANDIDIEFRRIDKICLITNALTKIVATENWILKVSPFTISAIHQSDASLKVKKTENFQMSPHSTGETQFLQIEIKSSRPQVEAFTIRINANDFKDLQDRVARTITIPENVKFYKTAIEQFIDVFKETIKNNERYETDRESDQCIGCLQAKPNVKIVKLCENEGAEPCATCYCPPMWCADCMAKWFASRQNSELQSSWLSSKCTCPLCRAKFCILDVCFLSNADPNNQAIID